MYSLSPFLAAYSTTLPWFIFFRSTTFIGVCVEFIAAITWLAEVFEDKKERERWLGITQAFASLGGIIVTLVSTWIGQNIESLPKIGFPLPPIEGVTTPGTWRWVLATGLFPAIPIAILLPFVPESRVWKEKRAAGTLKRPSIKELFAPQYIRLTLVTALLSACAYGIAFGALQLTPRLVAPGLPELKSASAELKPLRAEMKKLNDEFDKATTPEDKKAIRKQIGALAAKQKAPDREVKELGERVQLYQEVGGLIGRILLAVLIIWGFSRVLILKVFQVPALALVPLTFLMFYHQGGTIFLLAYGVCGLLTVAQFRYFGEYLPKVFPLHLRGTGGSFATNVGGRMIGTSMAVVTSNLVAPMLAGKGPITPDIMAQSAGYVAHGHRRHRPDRGFLLARTQGRNDGVKRRECGGTAAAFGLLPRLAVGSWLIQRHSLQSLSIAERQRSTEAVAWPKHSYSQ